MWGSVSLAQGYVADIPLPPLQFFPPLPPPTFTDRPNLHSGEKNMWSRGARLHINTEFSQSRTHYQTVRLHLSIYMESCWVLCIYLWYHQTGFHLVISQQISHTHRTRLSNSRQKKPDSKRQLTFLWRFSSAKINTHLDLFIFLRTNRLTMFKADRYVWVE